MNRFFIADTNTLISALLSPYSTNAKAIQKAERLGKFVFSTSTQLEFTEVLFRKKFDPYFSREVRQEMAERIIKRFAKNEPKVSVNECRDPKDNKFLELAVSVNSECIISGDKDLLVLNPFRTIPILNANDFLNHFQ